jgi:decaprenylphospho-beta-D-ribofuranose 2-oxidase
MRSYGDASLNSGGATHVTTRLDRIISFNKATGVLAAEAGVTLGALLDILPTSGWMPPVLPGTGFATLGGAIAMDVHGKNHHNVGSIANFITSIDLMAPDGTRKRVSPTRNKALFNATLGGLGQTGIIVSAEMQLAPAVGTQMTVTEQRMDNLAEFMGAFDSSTASYSVGWIDVTQTGNTMGRGILEEAEVSDAVSDDKLAKPKSVPFNAPSFLMSRTVVKIFNKMYFRRVPEDGRTHLRSMQDFFFPLDRIHDWNKLYGKTGFHQFQCVIPFEDAQATLTELLGAVVKSKGASPLAVLKKMGAGSAGLMSFPMAGYTLALDVPNRAGTPDLFKRLAQITEQAGGRIYLAKDSLAPAENIHGMYPELSKWQAVVRAQDPDGALKTDLIRRLNLRGKS